MEEQEKSDFYTTMKNAMTKTLESINSGIPLVKVHTGMLKISDVEKIRNSAKEICEAPIYLINELNSSFNLLELNGKN